MLGLEADDRGGMKFTDFEKQRVDAVRASGLLGRGSDPALDIIARTAAENLRASMGLVTLIDKTHVHSVGVYGVETRPALRREAVCDHALVDFQPLVIEDTLTDPRFKDNPFVKGAPFVRAYAGVPLINAHGFALGTLCVAERYPRKFTAGELLSLCKAGDMALRIIEGAGTAETQQAKSA